MQTATIKVTVRNRGVWLCWLQLYTVMALHFIAPRLVGRSWYIISDHGKFRGDVLVLTFKLRRGNPPLDRNAVLLTMGRRPRLQKKRS